MKTESNEELCTYAYLVGQETQPPKTYNHKDAASTE